MTMWIHIFSRNKGHGGNDEKEEATRKHAQEDSMPMSVGQPLGQCTIKAEQHGGKCAGKGRAT